MSETAIVKVEFSGTEVWAQMRAGEPWIAFSRACHVLGLDDTSQRRRLVKAPWAIWEVVPSTQIPGDDQKRDAVFVNLDTFLMWLATVHVSRVREDRRSALTAYQREAARVLREHFFGGKPDASTVAAKFQQAVQVEVQRLLPGMLDKELRTIARRRLTASKDTYRGAPLEDVLANCLAEAGDDGLKQGDFYGMLGGNKTAAAVTAALERLRQAGLAVASIERNPDGGRPATRWFRTRKSVSA